MPPFTSRFPRFPPARAWVLLCLAAPACGAGIDPPLTPRLPSLWSRPFLRNIQSAANPYAIGSGIFLGLEEGSSPRGGKTGPSYLVALEPARGGELWRTPWSGCSDQVIFAGDAVLLWCPDTSAGKGGDTYGMYLRKESRRRGRTVALESRTGKRRWSSESLPVFYRNLEIWRGGGREIGLGRSLGMKWRASGSGHGIATYTAVDLRTGDSLWQARGEGDDAAVAGADGFYLAAASGERGHRMRLTALDPVSGSVRRSFPLPIRRLGSLSAFGARSDLALLAGDITLALSLKDGRILWQLPRERPLPGNMEPGRQGGRFVAEVPVLDEPPADPPRAAWRDGRFFLIETGRPGAVGRIRELDPENRRELGTFELPGGLKTDYGELHLLAGPGKAGLIVIPEPASLPSVAIRFDRAGAKPRYAVADGKIFAAASNVALAYARDGAEGIRMEGYDAFREIPSEAEALDPPARVRAILNRMSWEPGPGRRRERMALDALRKVPGFAGIVAGLARDTTEPLRMQAFTAAIETGMPELAALLRAEISRPLPPIRPVRRIFRTLRAPGSGSRPAAEKALPPNGPLLGRRRDGTDWGDGSFEKEFRFRGYLILALAELDDPQSAALLASMLSDPASPTGYSLAQLERTGLAPVDRNGNPGWSPRAAFSRCLTSPGGRPEHHAAAYRMLARLGRPSDTDALRRFDAAVSAGGGWARLCEEDDRLGAAAFHAASLSEASGMCLGLEAGDFRVARAETFWLRRRGPGGVWGPPAWALDPGGDIRNFPPNPRSARLRKDGRIRLVGLSYTEVPDEKPWSAILDPRKIFADQDRDGLTDWTEKAFGTDPARADTDGDGTPDGTDPAPRAAPSRTDSGRAMDEAVRYLTLFATGGPVGIYSDSILWSGGGGARGAGVVVHRLPRAGDDPECPERGGCPDDGKEPAGPARIRGCEESLDIRAFRKAGDSATVVAARSEGQSPIRRLGLAKVAGVWRVVRDEATVGPREGN